MEGHSLRQTLNPVSRAFENESIATIIMMRMGGTLLVRQNHVGLNLKPGDGWVAHRN